MRVTQKKIDDEREGKPENPSRNVTLHTNIYNYIYICTKE